MPEVTSERKTMTVKQAKGVVGCGLNQMYWLVEQHNLGVRCGRKILVVKSRLDAFLEGQ